MWHQKGTGLSAEPVSAGGLSLSEGRSSGHLEVPPPQGCLAGGRRPPGLLGSLSTLLVNSTRKSKEKKEEIKRQAQCPG